MYILYEFVLFGYDISLCIYLCTYAYLHIYIYVHNYIYIFKDIYIYICIYIHMYTYTVHLMYAVCLTKRNAGVYHVLLERNAKGKQNTAICRICCLLLAKHRCLQFSCRHERKKNRK